MSRVLPLGLLALLSACAGHELAECRGTTYALNGEGIRTSVWDDGQQTHIELPGNTPMPAVFYKMPGDKNETVAQYHMEDRTLVVHGVYPQIILRSGDAVACLNNETWNPIGVDTGTGTVSPDIERVPASVGRKRAL